MYIHIFHIFHIFLIYSKFHPFKATRMGDSPIPLQLPQLTIGVQARAFGRRADTCLAYYPPANPSNHPDDVQLCG